MRKFFGSIGSVSRVTIESQALKSNMLGDPPVRVVDVYVPARHDGQGLPLLVDLVGFTGSGLSHTNWVGFRENLPERLDRLIGEQRMPPVVVAFPDCFTRLGGNQYINSASMGAWEDFLLHEMLPAIEQRFRCGGTGRRGVFGKSSGGYGAVTHAADRAWHAGPNSRDIAPFFDQARERLAPGGRVYILVSSDSDLNLFSALIARARFQARLVAERSIFIESLIIYELRALAAQQNEESVRPASCADLRFCAPR
jgi:Putative esterase